MVFCGFSLVVKLLATGLTAVVVAGGLAIALSGFWQRKIPEDSEMLPGDMD